KVAQYEVLGNGCKRRVRPVRDDRTAYPSASMRLQENKRRSTVPDGTDLLSNANPALKYWATFGMKYGGTPLEGRLLSPHSSD
ncbi:MAG: hypothetical protein WB696_21135, partial [Chthoniobacterales bacterium]